MLKTIQGKYTAIIILVVTLFLGVLLGINYLLLSSHSLNNAQETAELLLYHADREIDLVFEGIESTIDALSQQQSLKQVDVATMRDQFISHVLSRSEYVRAVYLGTADGQMHEWGVGEGFVDYTPTFPEGYDPRKRPWYRRALAVDGYALTAPYIYASVQALGVTAVKPVYDGDRLVGVLGLDLVLDGLKNLVESLKIQKGGKIILMTAGRQVLVNQFEPELGRRLELTRFEAPELLESSTPVKAQVEGDTYLFQHKVNASTGWSLLLFVPYQEILSFSQENFKIILFYDILLMMLLGSIVTFISKKLITDPINDIITVMDRHERGDMSARIPSQRTPEYQLIARLFNSLTDMRIAAEKKMEEQVQQRTRDVIRLQRENMRLRIVEEKERIYSNLHDSLGARLTSINISNNVAMHAFERDEMPLVRQMLDRIELNTGQGIQDLKEILVAKDSQVLTGDEFISFIKEQLRQRLDLKQIYYTVETPDARELEQLGNDLLEGLRRIIEELVTNTLKHSEARSVVLEIRIKGGRLLVTYQDDGKGFDLKHQTKPGFGLQGLYNRVDRLDGHVKVSTKPGRGVRFDLQIRLEDEQ